MVETRVLVTGHCRILASVLSKTKSLIFGVNVYVYFWADLLLQTAREGTALPFAPHIETSGDMGCDAMNNKGGDIPAPTAKGSKRPEDRRPAIP